MVFTPIQGWDQIAQTKIFPGESGGDYDALFGFSNRPGGQFAGVKPTAMTVGQVIDFTNPRGTYGQTVKGQIGRVATPVGAYQVVGTTLRAAVDALGLDPNLPFDKNTQDMIGQWIYANQGPGAWEGWGKGSPGGDQHGGPSMAMSSKGGSATDPLGYMMGGQDFPLFDPGPTKADRWRGGLAAAGEALTSLGAGRGPTFEATDAFLKGEALRRMQTQAAQGQAGYNQAQAAQATAAQNATAQWLAGQGPKGEALAQAVAAGSLPADEAVKLLYDPDAVVPGAAGAAGVGDPVAWLTKNGHTDLVEAVQAGLLSGEDAMTEALQRDPVVPVDPNAPIGDEAMANINTIRDDIRQDLTPFNETMTSAQNIYSAAQSPDPNGTNDFVIAQQFARLLDPASVVREGELAGIYATSSQLSAAQTAVAGILAGNGQRLPEPTRKAILDLTKQIVEVRRVSAQQKLETYRRLVERGGLDPSVLDLGDLPQLPDIPEPATPLPEDY